jgi:peptide/nickel transport system permease protein
LGGSALGGKFILPRITVAVGYAAIYARMLRSDMLETTQGLHRDGPGEGPVGASGGLQARTPRSAHPDRDDARHRFATILAGLVITENLIGLPGLGQLAVLSIASDDLPMVMGVKVIGSMFILTANIVDVAYEFQFLDPRVRY